MASIQTNVKIYDYFFLKILHFEENKFEGLPDVLYNCLSNITYVWDNVLDTLIDNYIDCLLLFKFYLYYNLYRNEVSDNNFYIPYNNDCDIADFYSSQNFNYYYKVNYLT